jgi:hypothetical protein
MSHYLLSVHSVEHDDGEDDEEPAESVSDRTPEEMEASMQKVMRLESEMRASGTFLFGGALTDAASATVVRTGGPDMVMTDGPFAEGKEHIGGFYIIEADHLDAALAWAARVVDAIGAPIEVRPFRHVS